MSEWDPNAFYYLEEDNVLGQHETSLNETKQKKSATSSQTVFAFVNSLLTELVQPVQGMARSNKQRKKGLDRSVSAVRTSRLVNNT